MTLSFQCDVHGVGKCVGTEDFFKYQEMELELQKENEKVKKLREVEARLEQSLLEEMRILDTEKEELRMMKERFLKEKKVLKHLGFS